MAKVSKKSAFNAKGVLEVNDDTILIRIEDVDEPLNLAEYVQCFDGQEVSVGFTQTTDIA